MDRTHVFFFLFGHLTDFLIRENCLCFIPYRWDVIRGILLVCSSDCSILGIGHLPVGTSSLLVFRRFSTRCWGLYFQRGIRLPSQNRNEFLCVYRLSSHRRCLVGVFLFVVASEVVYKLAEVLYIFVIVKFENKLYSV